MFHEPCHEPTTNVVIVNPHKIGGQSKVPIDMINPDDYDLVIMDEAHHYPAQTWSRIVDHFPQCKRLFLTATPCHNGKPLDITPCFTLGYENAVKDCIIRGLDDLCEVPPHDEKNLDEIYKVKTSQLTCSPETISGNMCVSIYLRMYLEFLRDCVRTTAQICLALRFFVYVGSKYGCSK